MRIQILDESLTPQGNFDFLPYEAIDGEIFPEINYSLLRDQNGKGTVIIKGDESIVYRNGRVTMRVAGLSTLSKLYSLRNHLMSGNLVRIFPKWQDDESVYYDGFLNIKALPEQVFFAGYNMAGKTFNIDFYELDLTSQSIVVDDEFPGDI